jgi:hypothetical protein
LEPTANRRIAPGDEHVAVDVEDFIRTDRAILIRVCTHFQVLRDFLRSGPTSR